MNYIINKFKTNTNVKRNNKTIYIYINRRVLTQAIKQAKKLYNLIDDEIIQLKNDFMIIMKIKKKVIK